MLIARVYSPPSTLTVGSLVSSLLSPASRNSFVIPADSFVVTYASNQKKKKKKKINNKRIITNINKTDLMLLEDEYGYVVTDAYSTVARASSNASLNSGGRDNPSKVGSLVSCLYILIFISCFCFFFFLLLSLLVLCLPPLF